MRDLEQRKAARAAEWKAITSPGAIAGGLAFFALLLFSVPVFVFLLPLAVGIMVVLYLVSNRSSRKAETLAKKRLGSAPPGEIHVSLSPGTADALVLNDWGVVYVKAGSRAIEVPWDEVSGVEEPEPAVLSFRRREGSPFCVDLSTERYFRATRAIHARIPDRTSLDVDPATGESNLLRKLRHAPREWKGRWGSFAVTTEGVEHTGRRMKWDEIRSVEESSTPGDECEGVWTLTFRSHGQTLHIASSDLSDGRIPGYSAYDVVRAIALERLPGRVHLDGARMVPTPRGRAIREFEFCAETTKAFALALKSGKYHVIEPEFRHMLALADTFSLDDSSMAQDLFLDYAELLRRTDRADEATRLEARVKV
jgi:hypothetical protein